MPRVVFLFFFLSGISALIFEVAWVRELSLIIGSTAQATSTVMAVFLGGLALGSYLAGKFANKLRMSPLKIYGLLEIFTGAFAFLVSMFLQYSSIFYTWLYEVFYSLLSDFSSDTITQTLRLFLSVLVLFIPTLLMGATLPVLVKYLETHNCSTKLFSLLYGVNTLGAVVGSLAACFFGFSYIGIFGTLESASAINLIVGLFSILISKTDIKQTEQRSIEHLRNVEIANQPTEEINNSKKISNYIFFVSFFIGFIALSYEVLWTRILRCYFSSITYSFTIMVSMFLFGLALGSFIYETRILKDKNYKELSFWEFGIVQNTAGFFCACGLVFFPHTALYAKNILIVLAHNLPFLKSQLLNHLIYISILSVPTVLLPATFLGILFPMLGTLVVSNKNTASAKLGLVYAINTIGCVCGSIVCGLILVPMIGSQTTFQWIVFLNSLIAAFSIIFALKKQKYFRLAFAIIPLILSSYFLSLHFHVSVMSGNILLCQKEDSNSFMRVIDCPKSKGIMLELNGSPLAGTAPANLRYMRLLAHLPLLIHPQASNVLVACYGTGTTAGAASLYESIKKLDIVEISRMIIDAAPYFEKTNEKVLNNPKVKVHINDVRNYLLTHKNKYDVITFEPPPPTEAGIVSLYTEEFYQLAQQRLNKNGLICQWIPMHQVSESLWRMMIASARAVFPYISIWISNNKEAIFLASQEPIQLDIARMNKLISSSPSLKKNLSSVGFDNAMSILSCFVIDSAALDLYLKDSLSITDNYPRLEFYMPYAGACTSELGIEERGMSSLRDFVKSCQNLPGFNIIEFEKSWKALHMLRELENTPINDHTEADKIIDTIKIELPENKWIDHIHKNRNIVYPNKNFNFTY